MPVKLPSFRRKQPAVVHSFDEDDLEQESPSTTPVAVVSFRKPKQQRSSIPQAQELVGEGAKAMFLSPERASRSILIPEVNLSARNKMQRNETRSSIDEKVDDLLAMITYKGDVPTMQGSQSPVVSSSKTFRSFQGSPNASLPPPPPPRRAVSLGNNTKSSASTIIGSNRRRGGIPTRSPALERRMLRCQGGHLSSPTRTLVDLPIDALSLLHHDDDDDDLDERHLSASSGHHKSTSGGGDVALRRRMRHPTIAVVPPLTIEVMASPPTKKKNRSSSARRNNPPRRRDGVQPTGVVRRRRRNGSSPPTSTTKTATTSKSSPHPISATTNLSSSPSHKCKAARRPQQKK